MDGVNLKDFISKTLLEICYGIGDAQNSLESDIKNCPIAPARVEGKDVSGKTMISFDIALTTTVADTSKKDGGVNIKVISGDYSEEKNYSNERVHRIKFEVPFYPQAVRKKPFKT